jgi:hypothetical protein
MAGAISDQSADQSAKRIESTEKPEKAARGRVVLAFWTAEASNWSQMVVCRHFYPLSRPDIRVTFGAVPRPTGSRLRTENLAQPYRDP